MFPVIVIVRCAVSEYPYEQQTTSPRSVTVLLDPLPQSMFDSPVPPTSNVTLFVLKNVIVICIVFLSKLYLLNPHQFILFILHFLSVDAQR